MITAREYADGSYLPARMLNEFTYCPRLFWYEHVEGLFVANAETVEGGAIHGKVDGKTDDFPDPESLQDEGHVGRSRSVQLASDRLGVIAKLDLIECDGERVVPVDYKRGRPRTAEDGSVEAWEADRIQMGVQAAILRDLGYRCDEAILWYHATRQRVRLTIDDRLMSEVQRTIDAARELARGGEIPPPLDDSPKCPRCSLVGICLPDETRACREAPRPIERQGWLFEIERPRVATVDVPESNERVRRLVAARDERRSLYLNTPGLHVGRTGAVLKVKQREQVIQEIRLHEVSQINLFGNIQLTTQAIQAACEAEIPIGYFSMGGWFYGITTGLGLTNIFVRREQFRAADDATFALRFSRGLLSGKLRNQRTLLQRNHVEPPREALRQLKAIQGEAARAESLGELMGLEGNGAAIYFRHFGGMLKRTERHDEAPWGGFASEAREPESPAEAVEEGTQVRADDVMTFRFEHRNRRPPRDPVNALLSLAYSLLAKDLMIACGLVGLDPYLGFLHQPRYGRASLALDLMEPFRPLIADSAVLSAINTRMVTEKDFVRAGEAVSLKPEGRKKFFTAYEQRMDALVTHPVFGYRLSYRRLLEVQTRLLSRMLIGEVREYPVFTTR